MAVLKRMFTTIVIVLVFAWLLLAVALYLFQSKFVYFPSKTLASSPQQIGAEYEEVSLTTADGHRLHGWYLPADDARFTLLFFHGNAGNISHRLDSLMIFRELGLATLIIDYRGYGLSEGKPSEKGTYLDAESAWDYLLKERGVKAGNIIIFGRSLGGGVATWLAQKKKPAALVIESTFTSITDIASSLYPYMPVRLLGRIRYENIERIDAISSPLLIIHSQQDELIPYSHGQALFQQAAEPKAFLEISGGHNGGFLLERDRYLEGLRGFLQEHLPPL